MTMRRLVAGCLVIVLLVAVFGFRATAVFTWEGAIVLVVIISALAVLALLGGWFRGRTYLD
jgi:hypothetical protein